LPQIYGSLAPAKPKGSSNLKYVVTGLIFLAGAAGLLIFLQMERSDPPAPKVVVPKPPQRENPLAAPQFVVEEEEKADSAVTKPETKTHVATPRGPWECSGDLPAAEIRQVVATNRRQVQSCYERGLKRDNVLQGSLELKLRVNSVGKIVATAVTGTLHDKDVFTCVRGLAEGWRLPAPTGGDCAVLQIPFRFSPAQDK
jgi:hypothetical protein